MDWDDVQEIPPWGKLSEWKELNDTFQYLMMRYKNEFEKLKITAYEIERNLKHLFPGQDELALRTCCQCHEPCCTTATVWLDFCDMVFLYISGQTVPELQLIARQPDTCRYHGATGCRLPRLSRPWVCTLYFCPPQKMLIRERGEDYKNDVDLTIHKIKHLRKRLEDEFISVLSERYHPE